MEKEKKRPHGHDYIDRRVFITFFQHERRLSELTSKSGEFMPIQLSFITFAAFSLEAFLNNIIRRKDEELLSDRSFNWVRKLEEVYSYFGLSLDKSRRPFQTLKTCFMIRDRIAHGKEVIYEVTPKTKPGSPFSHLLDSIDSTKVSADLRTFWTVIVDAGEERDFSIVDPCIFDEPDKPMIVGIEQVPKKP